MGEIFDVCQLGALDMAGSFPGHVCGHDDRMEIGSGVGG